AVEPSAQRGGDDVGERGLVQPSDALLSVQLAHRIEQLRADLPLGVDPAVGDQLPVELQIEQRGRGAGEVLLVPLGRSPLALRAASGREGPHQRRKEKRAPELHRGTLTWKNPDEPPSIRGGAGATTPIPGSADPPDGLKPAAGFGRKRKGKA